MKKLFALLLAVSLVFTLSVSVFAAADVNFDEQWNTGSSDVLPGEPEVLFNLDTSASTPSYVAGKTFNLVINITDIDLDYVYYNTMQFTDGLSMVAFTLKYDADKVEPLAQASADEDGDQGDFTSMLTNTDLTGWKGFGKLDTDNSLYELVFYDDTTKTGKFKQSDSAVKADNLITITVPFTVKEDVADVDIVFSFEDVYGCNSDWTKVFFTASYEDLVVPDSGLQIQPGILGTVPADAVPINYAGYKHEVYTTVLMATDVDTTIGALATKGDAATLGSETPDMNYWYVIIVDGDSDRVTNTYFSIGLENSDSIKTDVPVPAGSYVIGIHGASELPTHVEYIEYMTAITVGSKITLYNVNPLGVQTLEGFQKLNSAAYTAEIADKVPEDAFKIDYNGYFHGNAVVILADDEDTTIGALTQKGIGESKDMNYFAIAIVDEATGKVTYVNTTLGRPDGVKTDVKVPAGSYVIGVNGNLTDVCAAFVDVIAEGAFINLYNVDLDEVKATTGNVALDFSAFSVTPAGLIPVADAKVVVNEDSVVVKADNVSVDDFRKMFDNKNLLILDKDGKEVSSGLIKTGMKIDLGNGYTVSVLGDVNGDGLANSTDYFMLKRVVLNTYNGDINELAANINCKDDGVNTTDYIMLKRHVLGSYDIYK